ncbi:CASP-like protein 5C1 isoform X1 [Vigna umbellata]|nr:CASP-like protein 5C1 isoform X1 [Vigna umbellata]
MILKNKYDRGKSINRDFVQYLYIPCTELMDEVPGSLGTTASFSLRMGQTMFSSASLLFMSFGVEFYSYTAFCYLVTIMGLVIPWSFTLALVDGYSILLKCPIRQPGILLIIVVGDWVLSTLTLAAASSTASVVDLLLNTHGSFCPPKLCSRYRISAIMAFLSWFLSLASSLFNLWLLPSL